MFQRLGAHPGRLDKHTQILFQPGLADEVGKVAGPNLLVERIFAPQPLW
jgi:hypothetical protein